MSEFINFIEKWPVRKNNSPEKKLKLLKKSYILMSEIHSLDLDNREYWHKRMNKVFSKISDLEEEIKTLKIEGRKRLGESLKWVRDYIGEREKKEMM